MMGGALRTVGERASKERLRTEQMKLWAAIIENYSRRNITHSIDRLPALAGIIGELEKVWVDKCVAGLWKTFFLEHLIWQRASKNTTGCTAPLYSTCECDLGPRIRPNTLPSWSWLSCEGSVFFSTIYAPRCELISCSIQLLDENAPMGPIKGGKCVIRASIIKGPMHHNSGPGIHSQLDPIRVTSLDYCGFTCHEVLKHAIYARIGMLNLSGIEDPQHSAYKLSPMGLVLMEVGNDLFERVGTFNRLRGNDVFDDPYISDWKTLTII